jgi:IS30 family transposase
MHYRHLSIKDRDFIQKLLDIGLLLSLIAEAVGFHKSTVSREIRRNSCSLGYISHRVERLSRQRRLHSRSRPCEENRELMGYVKAKLKELWSLEQISNRIRIDYPENRRMRISHESIYLLIWEDKRNGGALYKYLPQGNRKRRKRYGSKEIRGQIPHRVWIDQRPKIVDRRSRIGDWEADAIEGAGKCGYIATFAERKSRYLATG